MWHRESIFVIFLIILSFQNIGQENYIIFDNANNLYENKLYDSAKNTYLKLYNKDQISKELLLNLGNSYFKLDSLPQAVLFYEKGLKLAPGNKDLLHNLQFCNTLLKDKNSVNNSIFINDLVLSFLGKSPNFWAYSSIFLLAISCVLFLFYWTISNIQHKRIYFYSLILSLLIFTFTIFLSAVSKAKIKDSNYAIIFSPIVKVMIAPSENASTTYQLHEGTKAKITGENQEWYEISFNDRKGWVPKKYLKKI